MIDQEHHEHYEVVNISDFTLNEDGVRLQHPCPCGDLFEITIEKFSEGKRVAQCPTCSLTIYIDYKSIEDALEKIHSLPQTA